jgi:hypothetical protein
VKIRSNASAFAPAEEIIGGREAEPAWHAILSAHEILFSYPRLTLDPIQKICRRASTLGQTNLV